MSQNPWYKLGGTLRSYQYLKSFHIIVQQNFYKEKFPFVLSATNSEELAFRGILVTVGF